MSQDGYDSFWDIEKLVPKRKKQRRVNFDVTAVELTDSSSAGVNDEDKSEQMTAHGPEPIASGQTAVLHTLCEYSPDNAFISRVRVCKRSEPVRYHEDFERTMHKYMQLTVKTAERVPFFSYVPRYAQLSAARLSWYLYWRSGCRRREYMQTDYSYVLLYVFELLNFDNPQYPQKMIEELCSLWRAYRGEYPQLDRCMPSWVCDYCLVHEVDLPYGILEDFLDDVLKYATLREFFLGVNADGEDARMRTVVREASGYNYRKSKYYTPENKELFDRHILSAAARGIGQSSEEICRDVNSKTYSGLRRDAYAGALCTSSAKRVLCIEYLPVYRSGELRIEATLAVKYAENKLRAVLGIRSRLNTVGLADNVKAAIDGYFWEAFGSSPSGEGYSTARSDDSAEYMAYYDSPSQGLQISRASDIEARSWETAELMGDKFSSDESDLLELEDVQKLIEPAEKKPNAKELAFDFACESVMGGMTFENAPDAGGQLSRVISEMDGLCREVLCLIAQKRPKDAASRAVMGGRFISDVCEQINESALEVFGDVIIENDSGAYYVLEDYESEVKKCLRI